MKLWRLEAIRGFSALYVVIHHTINDLSLFGINIGLLFRFGQEAVILFFLISGFVIGYSYHSGSDKSFKNYFSKRFFRIYIPLFFVFTLGYVVTCIGKGEIINPRLDILVKNILMLQDISALKPNVISEPYMNNSPLWSLSYEWWFYMLFFPAVTYVKNVQLRTGLVYLVSITACLIYVYWPTFIPRLLMYLGIWWSGVFLAEEYLKGKSIDIRSVKLPSVGLMIMAVILCINAWLYYLNSKTYSIGLHPLLEFRHMLFAFIAIHVAILWRKVDWFGFDFIFKPFVIFSPISYVIYISHYYLIAHASYFSFINQPIVEFMLYFVALIVFSSLIELKFYPAVKRFFRL